MFDENESFLFDDEDNINIYEIDDYDEDEEGYDDLQNLIDEDDEEQDTYYYDEDGNEYFDKDLKYRTDLYVLSRRGKNPFTGEVINIYITKAQQEKKERLQKAPKEKFVWLRYQENTPLFEDYSLNSADICRFIFASVHRNNDGEIFTNNHIRIDYSNLNVLMKLPKTTYHRFLKTMTEIGGLREWKKELYYLKKEFKKEWKKLHRQPKYDNAEEKAYYENCEEAINEMKNILTENEEELFDKYIKEFQLIKNLKAKVIIDNKYVNRGKLSKMWLGDDWRYIRLYKEAYRELYLTEIASHTVIGNLFQLVPYLNIDDNSIEVNEALEVLGIKKNNKHQFLQDMAKIKYATIENGTLYISKKLINNDKLDDIMTDDADEENEAY